MKYCPWCGTPLGGSSLCAACDKPIIDTRIGTVVGGRYRIDSLLGEGGMGRVYRATHLELGEQVVVKFLLAEWAAQPAARARFKREAVVLARLRHPAIVAIHDFGEHEGALYFAMEFLSGETLSARIAAPDPLPLPRVGAIFDQILQVLETAHHVGIIHRDLKPDNVMLLFAGDRTEHVKVLDFGLALVEEGPLSVKLTSPGVVQGTLSYMSPEQCRGVGVGPPTDIYAVGAMLFEVFTGTPLFAGGSPGDIMTRQIHKQPPAIADYGRLIPPPPGVEPLILRALAKKPELRPTAAEMRDLLAAVVRGTDAASAAARAMSERLEAGGRSRDERALPPPAISQARTVRAKAATAANDGPTVALWRLDDARAEALSDSLAVDGLVAITWRHDSLPPTRVDDDPIRVIVVGNAPDVPARIAALRAAPASSRMPILVLDVANAAELPALIRAGASDVALREVSDALLAGQIWRLVRRKR